MLKANSQNLAYKLHVILIYAVLALIVMGPMLKGGFVLTLDMVFTPKLPAPSGISNTYLFQWLLHIINFVVPGQVVEKLLILTILIMCGLGMHRLVQTKDSWPRYFAGVFYTINPFTYERWMAGQYLVLFGYALLPWLFRSRISFCVKPGPRAALRLSLWYTAIALVSVHIFVMTGLLGVIMLVTYLLEQSPKGHYYRDLVDSAGLVLGGWLVLNCYWLYYVVNGSSNISQTIDNVSSVDLKAFATASNIHTHLFFNVLSLYGFWQERFHRFAMPNQILGVWLVGFVLIAALVVIGGRGLIKHRSLPAAALLITFVIAFAMSLGPKAIILHVPLMKGFREPEKFSALLVLFYAYYAAYGLEAIIRRIPAKANARREILQEAALFLPVLYCSTMLFGFDNQLKAIQYPPSWYAYENQLKAHPIKGKILFLPWHEYMSYDFTPRIIANPAPNFFYSARVIAGSNAQFGGVDDPNPTPTTTQISGDIARPSNYGFGHSLANLHVQYVLLADGYDAARYSWLNNQTDLKLISSRPGLTVYENEAYHG